MEIHCSNIAKKFRNELLFTEFNYTFKPNQRYAILGPNSSGKSTLLKIIAAMLEPTEGELVIRTEKDSIEILDFYNYYSFSSPEMQLFNEFTVRDLIDFHFALKKNKVSTDQFVSICELNAYLDKVYMKLSSGLKNKIKLALALFTDTPILFLDEPCTNFDSANIEWYQKTIESYCNSQIIVVASNQEHEHGFCENKIQLNDFKK